MSVGPGTAPGRPAGVNAQYNRAAAESLSQRVAAWQRRRMFEAFMAHAQPRAEDRLLDIGVTSDQTYAASNYFELYYPWPDRIVAAGLDDASFLEAQYPGLRFVQADARALPFADGEFDVVHSSAVLEHVGSRAEQRRMLDECLRVSRRAVFLTTPNRWFPVEMHTQVPLLHWLPTGTYRALFRRMGLAFFAEEANLNLLSPGDLGALTGGIDGWDFKLLRARLLGWTSNLLLLATRR